MRRAAAAAAGDACRDIRPWSCLPGEEKIGVRRYRLGGMND